jgi:hypothetical protein
MVLLTKESITSFCDVPSRFYSLTPYSQSDYARFAILAEHGGTWLDSDFIVHGDLEDLFADAPSASFVSLEEYVDGGIGSAVMAARKGSSVARFFREEVDRRMREVEEIAWGTIGPEVLKVPLPEADAPLFHVVPGSVTEISANFADWRKRPGWNWDLWLKNTPSEAAELARSIRAQGLPVTGTWTIWRDHSLADAAATVLDDPRSVFHHLVNP